MTYVTSSESPCLCLSAMEEIVAMLRSLADDVENNRVEDTDAVDGVRGLGDRIDDLPVLVRFDASVVNKDFSSAKSGELT